MAKLKTIALTISGLSALSGTTHAQAASTETDSSSSKLGMAMMRLNSSLLDQAQTNKHSGGSLWASLRKDFRINEVNTELVRRHESKFAANGSYFDRTINRSKPYMYHIANEVKKRNMPAEIALLPFIESAFVTKAKSHVGASGLWQFMPSTGRHYGLEKTALYDGRHDVYASTNAALNYLEYLHGMFGDWSLALAAYNWGEGNVGRAINRARAQGLEPTYENLRMPNETRNYVPKLLAVRNIVSNPQMFGLNISEINNQPYFKSVDIDKAIDNSTIARFANISESELLALNPGFNAPVFIPKNNRKLLLPTSAIATFEKNYRNAKPENLLSWDIYSAADNTNLNTIAAETGMSVAELKRLNNISNNAVSAGRSILVAKNNTIKNKQLALAQKLPNLIDIGTTPDSYRPIVSKTEQIPKAEKPADLAAVTSQKTTASTIDFISRTKTEPAIYAAVSQNTEPYVKKQGIAANLIAQETDSKINPALTAATLEKTADQLTPPSAEIEPVLDQTDSITKIALNIDTPATAISLPEQQLSPDANQNQATGEQSDDLMSLVKTTEITPDTTNSLAAETKTATNPVNEPIIAQQARIEKIAENRVRQQHRIESRLARAEKNTQRTANIVGTHKVSDGDTLFNISQRYNLSVADLVTANNIKGNNIQKGQILRIIASPAKSKSGNIKNVSYTVRKGDTLNTIASRFNLDINDIRRWNRNTRAISPGQRLNLLGS